MTCRPWSIERDEGLHVTPIGFATPYYVAHYGVKSDRPGCWGSIWGFYSLDPLKAVAGVLAIATAPCCCATCDPIIEAEPFILRLAGKET